MAAALAACRFTLRAVCWVSMEQFALHDDTRPSWARLGLAVYHGQDGIDELRDHHDDKTQDHEGWGQGG